MIIVISIRKKTNIANHIKKIIHHKSLILKYRKIVFKKNVFLGKSNYKYKEMLITILHYNVCHFLFILPFASLNYATASDLGLLTHV